MASIEKLAPELDRLVSPDAEIEQLGSGYGSDNGPGEGPLWWKEGGYLLFSDVGNSKRYKWTPGDAAPTVFRDPTDNANGLTRDPQGRLLACEHGTRRVTRLESDGSTTTVANRYHGRRLNRPNDVVVKSDGSIYFTDPAILGVESELDFNGVYRVSADLDTIHCLVRDFTLPNGLCFSPDEKTLYINDSRRRHIRAFDLDPSTGLLFLHTERVFCQMSGDQPGAPDGMKCDMEGNVYCTGPGGLWIISPDGKHLGTILTGAATNLNWGGDDWKTLYYTTRSTMGRIQTNTAGVPVPRGQV